MFSLTVMFVALFAIMFAIAIYGLITICLDTIEPICYDWIDVRTESINRQFDFVVRNMKIFHARRPGGRGWSVYDGEGISSIRMFWLLKRFQWSGYSSHRLDVIREVCARANYDACQRRERLKSF